MSQPMIYLRAVLWSFAGIRQRAAATTEQQQLKPLPLIATALALVALLVLLLLGMARAATAQPLRVPDTMAQRALACTGCHGPQGRSTPQGYVPRIAGKPAGYLTQQLIGFRDGQRQHDGMARLLVHLDDAYLAALGEHFAVLDVAYPPPPPSQAAVSSLALGQQLVRQGDPARGLSACVRCHGPAMTGLAPAIPGLLGLPRDYLVAQLGAWRTGTRHARAPDCMAALAKRLQPQDILAVADWLAAQPLPTEPRPATQLPQPMPTPCGSAP